MSEWSPEFEEGDILKINGDKYKVDRVQSNPYQERVSNYILEPVNDAPPANLKPKEDGYVLHSFGDAEVEVVDDA